MMSGELPVGQLLRHWKKLGHDRARDVVLHSVRLLAPLTLCRL
jgi:hypothetical protein